MIVGSDVASGRSFLALEVVLVDVASLSTKDKTTSGVSSRSCKLIRGQNGPNGESCVRQFVQQVKLPRDPVLPIAS